LVLFSFRCGFGGGLVDLPVSDEDEEEEFEDEMDDSEAAAAKGSSPVASGFFATQLSGI
jgi:hypothetical protein